MREPLKRRIVIVEDEAVLLEFTRRFLCKSGFDVVGTAATGEDAVPLCIQENPDIILMDIRLRGDMDGIEAARRIHETRDIPILFVTAFPDPETVARSKAVSPYGYLVKPVDGRELEAALELALFRHGMEQELRRSNMKFRALLDASPDTILRIHRDGSLLESSVHAEHITEILAADVVVRVLACIQQCLKTGARMRIEYGSSGPDKAKWYELSAVRLEQDEVVAIIREITEHKKALSRATESVSMFQSYAQKLQAAREEERQGIAREIHDELGQTLVGLKMQAVAIRSAVGGEPSPETARLRGNIDSMMEGIDRAIREVRRITSKLRPLMLDDLGLGAALEWLRGDFEQRTGIRCTLSLADDVSVEPDRATAIFRIVQEALTNAARHSGAARVSIALRREGDDLLVTVRDNGRGMAEVQDGQPQGHGLVGMTERAAAYGGQVLVTGVPGKGAVVRLRIPIETKGPEAKP